MSTCAVGTAPRRPRPLLYALVGAPLLWGCFFPLNLGFLAWVALVPFLAIARSNARPRRVYLAGFLLGLLWFVPSLQWLRVAHPMMALTWIGLSLYCAAYVLAALWLIRMLDRRFRNLMLTAPAVWVFLEWVRGTFGGGFPWYYVGHSQHEMLTLIQVADITGVYGISFVIVLVNAWVYLLFANPDCTHVAIKVVPVPLAAVALLLGYGMARLDHPPFPAGPRVALLQGNVPQEVRVARNDGDEAKGKSAADLMREAQVSLSERAAALDPKPVLLVWPETSCPDAWWILPDAKPEGLTDAEWATAQVNVQKNAVPFAQMARAWQADVIFGLNGRSLRDHDKMIRWNTALLVHKDGTPGGVYHKMHRVPFGEFVPFKDELPFMKMFTPYDYDYGIEAGTDYTRFPLAANGRTYTYGVVICYEDTDPTLARRYNAGSEPVDFLVNISNDGWFKGTEEHEQHLATSRFRAIEARRALARSVNMGVSAVIDGDGRVVALPAETWAASKGVDAIVAANIPIDNRNSVYAKWGDWFPVLCGVLVAVGLFRRRRD